MTTPAEMLMDREKYPDDLEYTAATGEKHTLKEWRERTIPMSEFTKMRQQAADRIRELEQTQLVQQQQLAALANQKPTAAPDDGDDPYMAPIRSDIRTLQQAFN